MRLVLLYLLAVAFISSTHSRMFIKRLYEPQTDQFGRDYLLRSEKGFIHTIINARRAEQLFLPENQMKNIKDLTDRLSKKEMFKLKDSNVIQCQSDNPEVFKWTAMTVGQISKTNQMTELKDSFCFKEIYMELTDLTENSVSALITATGKKSVSCSEAFLVSTGNHFHFFPLAVPGVHKFTFENLEEDELLYIQKEGVRFLRFCDSIEHLIPDLLKTVQLFLGGLGLNPRVPFFGSKVPMEMQLANVKFIKEATGFEWRSRNDVFIDLDPQYLQSGDSLTITRFDGLDNIIHWGAGSHSGHYTMALWDRSGDQPELYIVESQDAWYWPTGGIQRTKWADWKKQARNADFNVAILPLRKEFADKFDEDKAWAWFRETEGMPYGYRNFLFGWIDTIKDNYPSTIDVNFVYLLLRLGEAISPEKVDVLVQEALNWRIGTKDLKLWEIEVEALKQNKNLNDLFAMTEVEGHKYSDGYSYVCSSYVMSFYTKSGMLGDLIAYATEFTPRDVYTLDVFDKNWTKPSICDRTDPDLPYCQIMGAWKMDLPGWSSITPYDHMAERCPSQAPDYFRPDGC